MTIWAGIDPGLSGAIAFIGGANGPAVHPMPLMPTAHEQDEVDEAALAKLLEFYNPRLVMIELLQGFPGMASATHKLAQAYGSAITTTRMLRFRLERVRPQTWQSAMIPGVHGRALLKAASVRTVKKLHPGLDLRGAGRTKPDDLADAVLLAEYARRTFGP